MAANSVFTEAANGVVGTFSSNNAGMSTDGAALGLVTNINIQYSQQVNRIFDMNLTHKPTPEKSAMYYIGGRAQGQVTLGRVLGPSGTPCDFYKDFGNVCGIQKTLILEFQAGKGKQSAVGRAGKCELQKIVFTIHHPLLTSIGVTQNSNDVIVNENITLMFSDLECA
jgi:hypothetical protein